MGLEKVKERLKCLNHKDYEQANKFLKEEAWEDLIYLLDTIIDDANVDVVLASEEDNGQLVKEKSEILDQLMKLKFAVEDYIEDCEFDDINYDDYDDDLI